MSFGLLVISVEADPNVHWLYIPSEVLGLLSVELAVTLCDLNYTTRILQLSRFSTHVYPQFPMFH